jgi:hypothetical protein
MLFLQVISSSASEVTSWLLTEAARPQLNHTCWARPLLLHHQQKRLKPLLVVLLPLAPLPLLLPYWRVKLPRLLLNKTASHKNWTAVVLLGD